MFKEKNDENSSENLSENSSENLSRKRGRGRELEDNLFEDKQSLTLKLLPAMSTLGRGVDRLKKLECSS